MLLSLDLLAWGLIFQFSVCQPTCTVLKYVGPKLVLKSVVKFCKEQEQQNVITVKKWFHVREEVWHYKAFKFCMARYRIIKSFPFFPKRITKKYKTGSQCCSCRGVFFQHTWFITDSTKARIRFLPIRICYESEFFHQRAYTRGSGKTDETIVEAKSKQVWCGWIGLPYDGWVCLTTPLSTE